MDKIDRFIQMMNQPDSFSDKEWHDVLGDKECREYYRLMCDISALNYQRPKGYSSSETEPENALCRFQHRYTSNHQHLTFCRKIAAIFIGLVLVSGLAFATIVIVKHHNTAKRKELVAKSAQHSATTKTVVANRDTVKNKPRVTVGEHQFVNAKVSYILEEIAAYYNLKVEVRSEKAALVRLYFNWNRQYDAVQVVEQLNQFEHIHIILDGNVLILDSIGGLE